MFKSVLFFVLVAVAFAAESKPKDDLKSADSFGLGYAGAYGSYPYLASRSGAYPYNQNYGAYPYNYNYGAYPYAHGAYPYAQGAYPYAHGAYPYSHGAYPYNYNYGTYY